FQSVLSRGARSDCYAAAQAALSGESPVGGCLYFNSGYGSGIQIGYQHFY
ncbi:MAG TPA: spore cortex-lytic protein, partial [Lachnospiraceae bacterium]|nr:spore cortex-lytic protein [Lachnospiraceae bacterium]